jgi:hypothetical protein
MPTYGEKDTDMWSEDAYDNDNKANEESLTQMLQRYRHVVKRCRHVVQKMPRRAKREIKQMKSR